MIAVHAHVEAADEVLAAALGGLCARLGREEDEAGAGAPGGLCAGAIKSVDVQQTTVQQQKQNKNKTKHPLDKLAQGPEQPQPRGYEGHGGALAARDDEGVDKAELLGGAHLDKGKGCSFEGWRRRHRRGGAAQQDEMLDKGALEGEHTHGYRGH